MRSTPRMFVAAALFALAVAAFAAPHAANPVVGTWEINLAKSKFNPGPPPKSDTRTYTESAAGLSMVWKYVDAEGKEIVVETTFKANGKDYPVKGSPNFDSLAVTKIDSHTVKSVQKMGGKVVAHTQRVVSKDGKVLTLTSEGVTATGTKFENVMVYDRK